VSKSQELVAAAAQQIEANLQQVEATFRPAVVAKVGPTSFAPLFLVNIGNGPAIEVRWSIPDSRWAGTISYLEPRREPTELNVGGIKALQEAAVKASPSAAGIECSYRSLSGRSYSSSNAFDFQNGRFSTTFTK
jgi:hypothetical protein